MKTRNNIITRQLIKGIANIFILLVTVFNFSCKKYLDVPQTSTKALISTASDCQLILNNYATFSTHDPSDGEAAADNYYLNDTDYGTLSAEDARIYTWAPDAQRSSSAPQWLTSYQKVYNVNVLLEALNKINADAATINDLRGQALFFRSYAFFQIAQLYCKPYTAATAGTDPGIPIRLSSDVNAKSVRGTVKQTYDQITGDLQTAVNALAAASTISSRPNKAAAYSLLARIYLAMGDYTNAGSAANNCLQLSNNLLDYNGLSTSSSVPFTPRFNKEVIFQSVMAPSTFTAVGNSTFIYGGTMNPAIAKIDSDLYITYGVNDLRKQFFFKTNAGLNIGSYKFKGNYEPVTNNAFFDGLATDEIYLTRAECYARAGNTTAAMADLNTLLRTRWATGTYTDMTASGADDALVKVLTERRKELLFRGLRWSDLRRLNLDPRFQVTLRRKVAGQTYTLPPNDKRYVQLIPVEVIANSTMEQNPR